VLTDEFIVSEGQRRISSRMSRQTNKPTDRREDEEDAEEHCRAYVRRRRRSSFHSRSLTIVSAVRSLVGEAGTRRAAKTAKRARQNCPGAKTAALPEAVVSCEPACFAALVMVIAFNVRPGTPVPAAKGRRSPKYDQVY